MKRLTQGNADELCEAAESASNYLADLSNSIQEWKDAKDEGNTEEDREAAAYAREEIDSAIDNLEVALGDLGYQRERS